MVLFFLFGLFGLFLVLLIVKSGKTIPILYLFTFSYYVQYVFCAYLIYQFYPALRKDIPISQDELFQFVVPAIASCFFGAILFYKEYDFSKLVGKIKPIDAVRLGDLLLIISFSIELIGKVIPVVNSINAITKPLRYVAFSCYIFNITPRNAILMAIVYITLLRDALALGMFLYLTTWTVTFILISFIKFQVSTGFRFLLIVLAIPLIMIVQSVKGSYRKMVYRGKAEAGLDLIAELAIQQQVKEKKTWANSTFVVSTLNRLNQSWHVSKVINWVPKRQKFANGSELASDIVSAFVPRVFYKDKKTIGDRSKFRKYTGIRLRSASMTVGVLGDFYLNFGIAGGCAGLFVFGAFMSWSLSTFTKKYVVTNPINLFWIPFIFIIWISANDELYTIINTAFKSYLVFVGANYLYNQIWPREEQTNLPETASV